MRAADAEARVARARTALQATLRAFLAGDVTADDREAAEIELDDALAALEAARDLARRGELL